MTQPVRAAAQRVRWHAVGDTDALCEAAFAYIADAATSAIERHQRFLIVLSGGNTPRNVYRRLRRLDTDWSLWHVYFGDERCLARDDPDRNSVMAAETWLDHVPIPPSQRHVIAAELGATVAARRYASDLRDVGDFDLVLLGLGEDGHVASVFPEHPAAYESRPVTAVRGSPKPPPVRITLSLPAINTAEEVWLVATGTDKASAVGMALTGAGPVQVPAAGVRGLSRTLWLLDRAAATEVSPRFRSLRLT